MARPKKKDVEKLTETLPPIRCTADENEAVRKAAKDLGLSIGEYLRDLIAERHTQSHASKASSGLVCTVKDKQQATANDNAVYIFDPDLVFQLRAIGNNLNQLTKLANSTGYMPPEVRRVSDDLRVLITFIFKHIKIKDR